ncbi:MAG: electron transport complex subunit RsxG [Nevskiales bacterium]
MTTFSVSSLREKLGYHPALLGLIALAASATLAVTDSFTHSGILDAEARDLQQSLAQVLPAGFADNDLLKDQVEINKGGVPVKVYRARLAGSAKGAVFENASRGYADEVAVLIGVDLEGQVLGVRVTKHKETPGLGDKIEIAKTRWITSFDGKSLGNPAIAQWGVKKDGGIFDQFAGATITPRAVVKAVREGLEFYAAHKAEIYAAAAPQHEPAGQQQEQTK